MRAVHPHLTATGLHTRFRPLTEHLSERLRRPVRLQASRGFHRPIESLGDGSAQFGFVGPTGYLRYPARPPDSLP